VRRADFLDALVKLVPEGITHFGKRLERLEEGGDEVVLRFEDGSQASASVVVGCDGIHSRVKRFVLDEEEYQQTQPRYGGMYGYRAVLDMETMVQAVGEQRARVSTMYIGDGAYGVTYPIMRAKKVNVGIYPLHSEWDREEWVRPASKEDMRRDFAHMGVHINSLIEVRFQG
jgi:salicylate hydroxylase